MALQEAANRCRGPEEAWMAQDLKRAVILIGGWTNRWLSASWNRRVPRTQPEAASPLEGRGLGTR